MKYDISELSPNQKAVFMEAYQFEENLNAIDIGTKSVEEDEANYKTLLRKWDAFIETVLSDSDLVPFIYYAFSRHVTHNMQSKFCMCCLRQGKKIADSHWVSENIWNFIAPYVGGYFTMPGVNKVLTAKRLTLKLFCTGSLSECEQKFSAHGETNFG